MIRDIILRMLVAVAFFALIGYCQESDEAAKQSDKARIATATRSAAHADEWHRLDAPARPTSGSMPHEFLNIPLIFKN